MKKILILVLLIVYTSANCQESENKGWTFSIAFGTSASFDIYSPYKIAINTFPSIGYVLDRNMKIRLEYQYVRFVNRSDSTILFEEIGDAGKIAIHAARFDYMFGEFEKCGCLQWYINFGPGLYWTNTYLTENNTIVPKHELNFGIGAGGALTLGLAGPLRAFFEVQYHQLIDGKTITHYIPFKLGLTFNKFY